MNRKIINFTGSPIDGATSSIIHPQSFPCRKASKVYFNLADAECELALGYKELGIEVEIVGAKATKKTAKKATKKTEPAEDFDIKQV